MNVKMCFHRAWRCFQWLGRPLLRHGVFVVFMVILMWTTYDIVGEPHTRHLDFYVMQFLMDLYVFCGVLCVLERAGRRHRAWRLTARGLKMLFYVVSYVACFVEAFCYMRFYLSFSPTMLNLVMETNGGESMEFLRSCLQSPKFAEALEIYSAILFANIVCAMWGHTLYARTYRWLLHGREEWSVKRMAGRFVKSMIFPTAACCLLFTTLVPWLGEKWKMLDYMLITETTEAEKITGNVFYSPALRVIYSAKFLHVVKKDTECLVERMMTAPLLSAVSADTLSSPRDTVPTIVLVIGESYNKHHASCYGYPLPTTPCIDRLVRQGSMTLFVDAVSPWNVTSNAFKSFLSTHSTDQPGTWTDGVLFPAIFRRAGYQVAFVTNQFCKSPRQNRSDFNGSFFLNDPRLDSLCFDFRNTRHYKFDGELLNELFSVHSRMAKSAPRNLCILHFMGQHVLYAERCPDPERIFTADDYDRPDLTPDERQIIADYDNATRYNDKVLAQVLDHFRYEDAVVIYLADHGDEVFDGKIGMFGRNHTAVLTPEILRGEFEVPMMVWTSPKFRRRHPETAENIRQAADRPFSTDDLPHLLLGLAGIDSPFYVPERDLFSNSFKTSRKRPIKNIKNYDDIIKK